MKEEKQKIRIASLLHDLRKLSPHIEDDLVGLENIDSDILSCIRCDNQHQSRFANMIKCAEKIASMTNQNNSAVNSSFLSNVPLDSIFNILNGNHQNFHYMGKMLQSDAKINFPKDGRLKSEYNYNLLLSKLKQKLNTIAYSDDDINALLEFLEEETSFLPSSAKESEINDISYFDHVKLATALVSCIYDSLIEHSELENRLKEASILSEKMFLLYSADISGIQDFIYTISSKGALKGLRARSFYLEIIMEVIVDELLRRTELSRANLIYTGGGHAYLLLPNTEKVRGVVESFQTEANAWFRSTFQSALYIASAYCECSANELSNNPKGSYRLLFRSVSEKISQKKRMRYCASEIMEMNLPLRQHERECTVCHRMDKLNSDGKCVTCSALEKLAAAMLKCNYFTIVKKPNNGEDFVALPFSYVLITDTEESLYQRFKKECPVRIFSKNRICDNEAKCVKMWLGDYASDPTFGDIASQVSGIKRIAVMRADIDNLGQAFVGGFPEEYTTLSRSSAFSRSLSLFFKSHINALLKHGSYQLYDDDDTSRKAVIVYSGGDDVFIVGGWSDIICFAVDLHHALERYTQKTLTISAGIGLYGEKYPIAAMAREVGALEDYSKNLEGKNAVTIFDESHRYSWDDFINKVLGEKLSILKQFFEMNHMESADEQNRGNALLYHILTLVRDYHQEDRLNVARFAYLLFRLKPDNKGNTSPEAKKKEEIYQRFSNYLYQWIQDEKEKQQLITAIQIYVYRNRVSKGD